MNAELNITELCNSEKVLLPYGIAYPEPSVPNGESFLAIPSGSRRNTSWVSAFGTTRRRVKILRPDTPGLRICRSAMSLLFIRNGIRKRQFALWVCRLTLMATKAILRVCGLMPKSGLNGNGIHTAEDAKGRKEQMEMVLPLRSLRPLR